MRSSPRPRNFSFLRGASHPQQMVSTALALGHAGIGIADRNTVAGVVRAHATLQGIARAEGVPPPRTLREGLGPGEHVHVEDPLAEGDPVSRGC